MIGWSRNTLIALCCLNACSAFAIDPSDTYYLQQANSSNKSLLKYFKNLGAYLGYDVTQSPTNNNQNISQKLINANATQLTQNYLYNAVLGAAPVNTFAKALMSFVPNTITGASTLNAFANYTFSSQPYSSASTTNSQQGSISVSNLIDQKTYQADPVSQYIVNLLGTPDYSYCMNNDETAVLPNCQEMVQYKVMANVIGMPIPYKYYDYQYTQEFLSQLNSNNLIAPLMYSTQSAATSNNQNNQNAQSQGLTAQNQAQNAANFVRYASGAVAPLSMPSYSTFDNLYQQAFPANNSGLASSTPTPLQLKAQGLLVNYFANLRIYTAQSSVAVSNLYYMLSKRMPQNQSADTSNPNPISQALSEFNMASRRLYNSDASTNKQWLDEINNASAATVQKEMVTLLAEINYQLYLNRQQQERLLLTNTMILMQNLKQNLPDASLTSSGSPTDQSTSPGS